MPRSEFLDSATLSGDAAVEHARQHGLRVLVSDALYLDPRRPNEHEELRHLIADGFGNALSVEDPASRRETS